ncbi:unnamed protein product [Microthlaspi erraticum]|uniref:F-box domain-containing protein n=1 Tax=Microthlaspi erraticum TaxID=1685480 RepID=A0A6D2JXP6_9BRAS|nr:unnamed protein product [Microthlaspi erraticum]
MIMSDLPHDLLEDILSRVPARSLKRLRYTCKLWNALFKDQGFTNKHFRKAPKQSMVLMVKEHRVVSTSVNLNVGDPLEFKGALVLKDSHSNPQQVDISYISSNCDGLLLCATKDHDRHVLWNPCLGETKWIQSKTGYDGHIKLALGYVSNKSCRSYKILRWYDDDKVGGLEIYEFGSDSWRVLDHVALDYSAQSHNVSLKGNAYWIANKQPTNLLEENNSQSYIGAGVQERSRYG